MSFSERPFLDSISYSDSAPCDDKLIKCSANALKIPRIFVYVELHDHKQQLLITDQMSF